MRLSAAACLLPATTSRTPDVYWEPHPLLSLSMASDNPNNTDARGSAFTNVGGDQISNHYYTVSNASNDSIASGRSGSAGDVSIPTSYHQHYHFQHTPSSGHNSPPLPPWPVTPPDIANGSSTSRHNSQNSLKRSRSNSNTSEHEHPTNLEDSDRSRRHRPTARERRLDGLKEGYEELKQELPMGSPKWSRMAILQSGMFKC